VIDKTVNIITRTSNRPLYFKRNELSVKNQTYKKIIHHVITDNIFDLYVKPKKNTVIHHVNHEKTNTSLDIADPMTGGKAPYNLYFNDVLDTIESGWILYLDDDDYLLDDTAIERLISKLNSNDDMLIFQMRYENGMVLPPNDLAKVFPVLYKIGSPCIMANIINIKNNKWDGYKCGDYRHICKVYKSCKTKLWLVTPYVGVGGENGRGNLGGKNDLINLL